MFTSYAVLILSAGLVLACPDHTPNMDKTLRYKRSLGIESDWSYEASQNWAEINESYALCGMGTTQSPIPLSLAENLSEAHRPTFNIPSTVNGTFENWGYGPGFTVGGDLALAPTVTFQEDGGRDETAFLSGWHIHSPSDHTVDGYSSQAELHFVFARPDGTERAVFGFRIDPLDAPSAFVSQWPTPMISWRDVGTTLPNTELDLAQAFEEANNFGEFWTYRGSLTSPPCTEDIRWYMARDIVHVSHEQLQEIKRVSRFSARELQNIWLHDVNQ